ncbi:MAG: hypothetical protein G01um101466_794 [Parcubacteria group bacterium Gr01-1014_66]|nr:MAG: hypothetical protein G01um101466_794 [Parcubacteria group bacterium Gr01-1014_66]
MKKILLVISIIMIIGGGLWYFNPFHHPIVQDSQEQKELPIMISGKLFQEVEKGEWAYIHEQLAVFVRTKENRIWVFSFSPNGRKEGKFQSFSIDSECGTKLREPTLLEDTTCVRNKLFMSWEEIKQLLRGKLQAEPMIDLYDTTEKYLRKEKILPQK